MIIIILIPIYFDLILDYTLYYNMTIDCWVKKKGYLTTVANLKILDMSRLFIWLSKMARKRAEESWAVMP